MKIPFLPHKYEDPDSKKIPSKELPDTKPKLFFP